MKLLELGIDFSDSYYKEMKCLGRDLVITVVLWNEKLINVVFLNVIKFNYIAGSEIADIYEDDENLYLIKNQSVLCKDNLSCNSSFKKFRILDIDDNCIFKIIAENVVVSKE